MELKLCLGFIGVVLLLVRFCYISSLFQICSMILSNLARKIKAVINALQLFVVLAIDHLDLLDQTLWLL
jgi:hypothetical protein